jgi:tungstate transport system ATP-binding protein
MNKLIEVSGLVKRRDGQNVLKVDEFSLHAFEVVSILGANGVGKSTLLRVLAGIESFDEGTLRLFGEELFSHKRDRGSHLERDESSSHKLSLRRRISLVLQKPWLLDIPVVDNVSTGLFVRGEPKGSAIEIAMTWLETFKVAHLAKRNGHELSGGEAQRVSLARSFAFAPEVLLLDEPFSQLDQPARSSLIETLLEVIRGRKQSVILVTHERREAKVFASRVAVMGHGTILQDGPLADVFDNPCCDEVASFVKARS